MGVRGDAFVPSPAWAVRVAAAQRASSQRLEVEFVIRKELSETIVLKSFFGEWVLYKCEIAAGHFRRLYPGSSNCVRILLKLSYKRIKIVL